MIIIGLPGGFMGPWGCRRKETVCDTYFPVLDLGYRDKHEAQHECVWGRQEGGGGGGKGLGGGGGVVHV